MCRAILIKNLKQEKDENIFGIVLNYTINSMNKGNRDGAFINFDGQELKTLDNKEFINFLLLNRDNLNKAKSVMLHLRMSTNKVSEEFIHGWKYDNYTCYHNGVIELKNKSAINDSLDFFNSIFKQNNELNKEKLQKELNKRWGSGAFFFVDDFDKDTAIVSKEHKMNFHLINNTLVVINSNDDVHDFDSEIELKEEKDTFDFGKLRLINEANRYKIISCKVDIESDYSTEIYNEIVWLSEGVPKLKEKLKFKTKQYGYYSNKKYTDWDSGEWEDYKEEEIEYLKGKGKNKKKENELTNYMFS